MHIFKLNKPFSISVVESKHLSETIEASFRKHSLLAVILPAVGLGPLLYIEICSILFAPMIYNIEMKGSKIGIDFKHELLEGDSTILVLIQKIVQTRSHAFHMVVFLLAETIYKVFNEYAVLTPR